MATPPPQRVTFPEAEPFGKNSKRRERDDQQNKEKTNIYSKFIKHSTFDASVSETGYQTHTHSNFFSSVKHENSCTLIKTVLNTFI